MDKNLKIIDLFSGGGGFSYAAEKLVGGFETIQFCEIDSYCQKVLKKHWPTVPIHDDIKTYKPKPNSASVIVGGFPCTDISTAGKGLGITKETRSGLFYELMRVVCLVRPKYVIMENVAAILNNGMGTVLGELCKARYDAEWSTFRASDYVKTCHHRDRWWLIARNRDFANSNKKGLQGKTSKRIQRKGLWPAPTRFCNPNWRKYGVKPAICRTDDGSTSELFTNRANRLKLLGNGLIPQCAAIPLRRVLDLENES
tara:strand:+ start:807 stop:1574 length:768 start_codon:yes stop_codon:yes gene_type:complete